MTRTGDQSFIKDLNKAIVLNTLRLLGPISRADLSRQTGLNKATISSMVDELLREGYALEVGHGQSHIGRRPVLLQFNPQVGSVIGVDLGTDYIRVLLLDLSANVISTYEESFGDSGNPQKVIAGILKILRQTIQAAPPTALGVIGVGIGVPALVDAHRGLILNAPNLHWNHVDLKASLEQELGVPVVIDNEANAGAMGEKLFGAGKDVSNLVYVSVSSGIGTGIILNSELIRGEAGVAGEFGHMTIEVDGLQCACGNHGCLEMYASEKALVRHFHRLSNTLLSTEEILRRLQSNDPTAIAAIQTVGHYLGIGIASLLNGLNPALILIGNRLATAAKGWLIEAVEHTVRERCFISPYASFQVVTSSLGGKACAIGAASLVLHQHFAGPKAAV